MNFIFYKRVDTKTLKGTPVTIIVPRFLGFRKLASKIELWIAKKICPHGWTVVDEADVSYFEYLKDLKMSHKAVGYDPPEED